MRFRGWRPVPAVTVTIGVAVWDCGEAYELVSRADAVLYAGEDAGRDNVQLAALEKLDCGRPVGSPAKGIPPIGRCETENRAMAVRSLVERQVATSLLDRPAT